MLSASPMNRLPRAILILSLELILLVPTCLPQVEDRGQKSVDQYWAETGLGSGELESLLSPETCRESEQSFLACVNALSVMAERFGLALTSEGKFRSLTTRDIENKATEKKDLSPWVAVFESQSGQIPFQQAWKNLEAKARPGEKSALIAAGINGFLSVFKDPHTYIMPLALFEEVIASSESRNTSSGMIVKRVRSELVVRKVLEGSPAHSAGLKKGDRIVAMNGKKISELLPSATSEMVKMRSVERLSLQVLRGPEKKYFEILRSEKTYPSLVASMINGPRPVGVLTIHKFSKGLCALARNQLIGLKEQNIQGLLLDLRDNPGGQVEEAACVANLFIAKGTLLFETRYLDLSRTSDRYVAENEPIYKGPLAVLINSGSASAAEIVAGALRDQNRAKLVGERTYGKGSFQDGRIWGPNPKIALFQTEGLYYFPSGWTPQLVGLQPDVKVDFNVAENGREEDLFLNPLIPVDSWTGPQTLSWLNDRDCEAAPDLALTIDDPQILKAQAILNCGDKNDRNGSL